MLPGEANVGPSDQFKTSRAPIRHGNKVPHSELAPKVNKNENDNVRERSEIIWVKINPSGCNNNC